MNSRRDYRGTRSALFDGIEEGGLRASQYSTHEISEHDNDLAIEGLQDRVNILKRVISMKRLIVTTDFSITWAVILIHQEEFSLELWIASRWFSRPNQAVERQPLLHRSSLSSYLSISSPSSRLRILFEKLCSSQMSILYRYVKYTRSARADLVFMECAYCLTAI